MINVIALDPGFGNTKCAINGEAAYLQTAVVRPRSIGQAAIGMKTSRNAIDVTVGNQRYMVGKNAWNWGTLLESMDYSAMAAPERLALFYAAISKLIGAGNYQIERLVVGLPVQLLQDNTQASAVFGGLRALKRAHEFSVDGRDYKLTIHRLTVLAQPVGAYADWLLDDELKPRVSSKNSEIAILDLGMNTLDLYAINNGRVMPRFIGGDKHGVRRLLELMNNNGHDLTELDSDLRAGRLKPNKSEIKSWLGEILASLESVWPRLRRFDALIPTGGGAIVLGAELQNALVTMGATVYWPDDPITANVLGLWKWGAK